MVIYRWHPLRKHWQYRSASASIDSLYFYWLPSNDLRKKNKKDGLTFINFRPWLKLVTFSSTWADPENDSYYTIAEM